jgi:hypothetical protein
MGKELDLAHIELRQEREFPSAISCSLRPPTTIIGVSADSIARLDLFSADPDYCAGKFLVASDPDRKIANCCT